MTIFGKIDFWSDQGCWATIAAIFNSIWQTNDHESANGTNFFFTFRRCTYKISSQIKYTRKCTLNLTELLEYQCYTNEI